MDPQEIIEKVHRQQDALRDALSYVVETARTLSNAYQRDERLFGSDWENLRAALEDYDNACKAFLGAEKAE